MIRAGVSRSTGRTGNASGAGLPSGAARPTNPRPCPSLYTRQDVRPVNHDAPTLSDAVLPCQRRDPELWFSEFREDVAKAKKLCGRCPAAAKCLAGATARREPLGVWGGVRFHEGRPLDRVPARARVTVKGNRAAVAEANRRRRLDAQKRRRDAARYDAARVEQAVAAVGAREPVGEPLTLTERRAVIGRVRRYGLSAGQLAELIGCSDRTVERTLARCEAAA